MASASECALLSYLKQCSEIVRSGAFAEKLHVVLGNEACDFDSVVSALTYAFYRNYGNSDKSTRIVPMLNIVRRDFPLRTESRHALNRYGITASHLTFKDDLDLNKVKDRLHLTLVDHNVLGAVDESLDGRVREVIDHRIRARPEQQGVDVHIELVGSCSTLVAEKLLNDTKFTAPKEILQLLHECIVLDTVCLSEQAGIKTPKDEQIVGQLESLLVGVDRQKVYNDIHTVKTDVSGLLTEELLRKDLKILREDGYSLAMCCVAISLQDLLSRENIRSDLESFTRQQEVAGVVLMAFTVNDSGEAHRQLAVYCQNNVANEKICLTLTGCKNPDTKLTQLPCAVDHVTFYDQGDVTVSRKKIIPVLVQLLKTL